MTSNQVNIYEYEELAKERLNQGDYDFIAGAATDEIRCAAPAPFSIPL